MKTVPDKSFPGDSLIPCPRKIVTNSILIKATPERIWPWLIQLGSGRAGWYSFDKIDNGGIPSAARVIPELQHIRVGDLIPAVPGTKDAFIVREVDPFQSLTLVVPVMAFSEEMDNTIRMKTPLRVSWSLILKVLDDKTTELISHGRISDEWLKYSPSSSKNKLFIEQVYRLFSKMPWVLIQPLALVGHYVMESRMLKSIKRRAELDSDQMLVPTNKV